jgi:hypothetical protein
VSGALVTALIVAVVVALTLVRAKRSGSLKVIVSKSTRALTPEEFERVFENPEVQATMRAEGLDPAALAADLHSGKANVDGNHVTFVKSFHVTTSTGSLPELPHGAHTEKLSPEELEAMLERDPAAREEFAKAGIDLDDLKAKLQRGEAQFEGTKTALPTDLPAAPQPPQALDSDDGDKVWKSGKL